MNIHPVLEGEDPDQISSTRSASDGKMKSFWSVLMIDLFMRVFLQGLFTHFDSTSYEELREIVMMREMPVLPACAQ